MRVTPNQLPAILRNWLQELAGETHRRETDLAKEAIAALANRLDWDTAIDEGIAAAEAGHVVDADDVESYWPRRLAGLRAEKPRCG